MEFPARACSKVAETNLNCPGLLSSTPRSRFAPVRLKDLKDLELEVDVARRLRLAVIAHISCCTRYRCLLARTILAAVADPIQTSV
jgi:hypothetical protein